MKFIPTEDKLIERVKELRCLYEISKTISRANGIEKQVFKKIISSTKKAWKYSVDAIVEIEIPDYALLTLNSGEQTVCQISAITISDTTIGFIKVHYPENKFTAYDFLREEQRLLDTIAFEIGNYIEKYQNLEKKRRLIQTIERIDRLSILGEMTAGVAHELNTPLHNILGYAELIKSTNSDPEIDDDIATVINSVIYSREIVKKILNFSCELPQELQLKEIKPIVTFALSFLKQNFQKKNIKSELIFQDETVTARIDAVQITQVLFNLILNAIQVSPKKSTIKISIKNDTENLFINIEDQGTGIPDLNKEKIFEAFYTTKAPNNGCGLGLSVVHRIVKNHKGEIKVLNNSPSGTIFIVKIPLR